MKKLVKDIVKKIPQINRIIEERNNLRLQKSFLFQEEGALMQQINEQEGQDQNNNEAKAKELNRLLFEPAASIDVYELADLWELFHSYCVKRKYDQEFIYAWHSHRYRLYLTIKWIKEIIDGNDIKVVVETGEESAVSDILRHNFPQVEWIHTKNDLRYDWEIPDETADLIISTEVVEHLSDIPNGINEAFYMSGLKAMLNQSFKALKKGGYLFLTTPNVASVLHIHNILSGELPLHFEKHVREYTVHDLIKELEEASFKINRSDTVHCLTVDYKINYDNIFKMLLDHGYKTTNRGDDIFIVASK
jgi:hypothetical protein